MRPWADILGRVAAVVALSVAAWASLGELAIVQTHGAPARLGLLPPWFVLPVVAVLAAVALGAARIRRSRLWPCALPLVTCLAWIPGLATPVTMLWAGPCAAVPWTVAVTVVLAQWRDGATEDTGHTPRSWRRRHAWVPFALALVVYGAVSTHVSVILPGGDEPHYLIITQSLLRDGDLRIENNHNQGDYLSYFRGRLRPDFLRRGVDRQIYSIHLPGVSALVAPAFALGGYPLVRWFLAALAALGAAAAWRAAYQLTGRPGAAWFAWSAVSLTAPFVFLTFTVYPDGPGAVGAALIMAALVSLDRGETHTPRWWAALGSVAAVLPWFHPRFAVVASAFGLVLMVRAWQQPGRWARLIAFGAAPATSALAWFGYYVLLYGTPNPSAAYGHYTQMAAANISRGLLGFGFDQQFGLLSTAPVFGVVIAGVVVLARQRPRLAVEWLIVVVPYTLLSAMYHMWWGGHSSPVRFLGVLLLLGAVPAAMAWHAATTATTRTVMVLLLGLSLLLAGTLAWVEHGRLVFNVRDGMALWAVWATRTADLARGLPSVFRTPLGTAAASAAAWVVSLSVVWFGVRTVERAGLIGRAAAASWSGLALLLAMSTATAASWQFEGTTGLVSAGGQLALMRRAAAAGGSIGVTLDPFAVREPAHVVSLMRYDGTGLAGRPPGTALWATRLPAGRYRVVVDLQPLPVPARLDVVAGRGEIPVDSIDLPSGVNRHTHDLLIPWTLRSLALRVSDPARRAVRQVILEPLALWSNGINDDVVTASIAWGDVMVWGIGETVYVEPAGLWVAGRARGRIVLTGRGEGESYPFRLRAGAAPMGVQLEAGSWRQSYALAPGETHDLDVPAGDGGLTILCVDVDNGFRPSEVEPGSQDSRLLGAWVERR